MTPDLFSGADCVAVVPGDALHTVREVEGAPGPGRELGLDAAGAGGGHHGEGLGGGGEGEQQQAPGHREMQLKQATWRQFTRYLAYWHGRKVVQ